MDPFRLPRFAGHDFVLQAALKSADQFRLADSESVQQYHSGTEPANLSLNGLCALCQDHSFRWTIRSDLFKHREPIPVVPPFDDLSIDDPSN